MNSIKNSVQLIGNLGKEIELQSFDNGSKLVKLSIATNEFYKNKKGEKMQNTEWHNAIAWGNLAENMSKVLDKGNEVAIKGKLTHRTYEDKEGNTRYITEVVVNEFMKLTKAVEVNTPF